MCSSIPVQITTTTVHVKSIMFMLSYVVNQMNPGTLLTIKYTANTNIRMEDERQLHDPSRSSSSSSDTLVGPAILSRKVKLLTAASIFYGNVVLGCSVNTYGPALTSFQKKYDTTDETISMVFTISTGGILIGAITSGFLFKYVNRQLAVAAFFGCMGALMFLTPFLPTLTLFFVTAGILGSVSGFYSTAQFVWIMEMMQKDCPPYVQSQHFFYALGTILSSLVMAPFLDKEKGNDKSTNNTNISQSTLSLANEQNLILGDEEEESESGMNSRLFVPYVIVGCLLLIAMISQIILFLFFRYHPPPPEVNPNECEDDQNEASASSRSSPYSWPRIRMIILSCLFFGALGGMENSVIQFLPKFGQNSDLHLTEQESTYILTGLTTSYAAARFVCIFIVFKVPSQVLLCGNIVISTIATTLLTVWASASLPVLWSASILFGLGFSSMFASFSGYLERYLQVTDAVGSLIMVTGSGVAGGYPLIIGRFIDENPAVLGYTTFASIAVCAVTFAISSYLTGKDKTRY